MATNPRYRMAWLILFAILSPSYFERRALSVPDAAGSRLYTPAGEFPVHLAPDPVVCERAMAIELDMPVRVLRKGQPVLIHYAILNRSRRLTAEFDDRGALGAVALSAFSATSGERLPEISTGRPKVLGVWNTHHLGPGATYEGARRIDTKYDFSKPGLYRIVGHQHSVVYDGAFRTPGVGVTKSSKSLFIKIID